tara:strand:+ start:6022 stop:6438 length:417 start_codon:yes stop_codon:yes gene_type:complete
MQFNNEKNFVRITFYGKKIELIDVKAFSPFGTEYYSGKRLMNLSFSPQLISQIKETENIVQQQYEKEHIQSGLKNNLLRVYFDRQTKYIDTTHKCRGFGDLVKKETYEFTILYKGIWSYSDRKGHYWLVKSIKFIELE